MLATYRTQLRPQIEPETDNSWPIPQVDIGVDD
ncbi:MAG: hypothetical protein ACI9OD_005082, partial [Limisphaerales bacterium]